MEVVRLLAPSPAPPELEPEVSNDYGTVLAHQREASPGVGTGIGIARGLLVNSACHLRDSRSDSTLKILVCTSRSKGKGMLSCLFLIVKTRSILLQRVTVGDAVGSYLRSHVHLKWIQAVRYLVPLLVFFSIFHMVGRSSPDPIPGERFFSPNTTPHMVKTRYSDVPPLVCPNHIIDSIVVTWAVFRIGDIILYVHIYISPVLRSPT